MRIGTAGRTPLLLLLLTVVCMNMGTGAFAASARAEGCPNEQLRGQDGYALALPDCRAYEQVSPVAKNFTDAIGFPGLVQSSPSGEAATFFSIAPFPGVTSAASIPTYLSIRGAGGWSTQGLAPAANPPTAGGSEEGLTEGLTEDLSEALILVEPGLEVGLAPGVYSYLRDSATGAFQPLGPGVARFADAAAGDSRILFESREQLLPGAAPGVVNLYEWAAGRLILAGILPASEGGQAPVDGSFAGPGGPALGGVRGGATGKFYTQDTISADGLRVFFSDAGTGRIYMREPEAERTIPVSAGTAYWRAATADGSYGLLRRRRRPLPLRRQQRNARSADERRRGRARDAGGRERKRRLRVLRRHRCAGGQRKRQQENSGSGQGQPVWVARWRNDLYCSTGH